MILNLLSSVGPVQELFFRDNGQATYSRESDLIFLGLFWFSFVTIRLRTRSGVDKAGLEVSGNSSVFVTHKLGAEKLDPEVVTFPRACHRSAARRRDRARLRRLGPKRFELTSFLLEGVLELGARADLAGNGLAPSAGTGAETTVDQIGRKPSYPFFEGDNSAATFSSQRRGVSRRFAVGGAGADQLTQTADGRGLAVQQPVLGRTCPARHWLRWRLLDDHLLSQFVHDGGMAIVGLRDKLLLTRLAFEIGSLQRRLVGFGLSVESFDHVL